MANVPVRVQNDIAIQNNTTGAIDYLHFQGSTLTGSALFDYGLAAGMNIVGNATILPTGGPGLVAQNPNTGVVDILGLDSHDNLVASQLVGPLPQIVGRASLRTRSPGSQASSLSPNSPMVSSTFWPSTSQAS
jgi:hypothetical protein